MPTVRERSGRFQAQVRIKREGAIVYEESATFDTRQQALTWGNGVEAGFKKGSIRPVAETRTLAEVATIHKDSLEKAGREVRGISNGMDSLGQSKLGKMPISLIQSGDIMSWAKNYSQGRSPATVLLALMVLRAIYSTARTELNIKVDVQEVADAIKQLKRLGIAGKSIERDRRVTDEEIDRIAKWHEALRDTTIPLRTIMNLAVALPRRRGELLSNMEWKHYDGTQIKLFDTKDPSGQRNEVVPVPPAAKAIIDRLPRISKYILPHTQSGPTRAIYDACQMLQIEDLHFHDLRHEGISRLFEQGLDIPRVAMISGHKSWQTLKRYVHLKPADVVKRLKYLETSQTTDE